MLHFSLKDEYSPSELCCIHSYGLIYIYVDVFCIYWWLCSHWCKRHSERETKILCYRRKSEVKPVKWRKNQSFVGQWKFGFKWTNIQKDTQCDKTVSNEYDTYKSESEFKPMCRSALEFSKSGQSWVLLKAFLDITSTSPFSYQILCFALWAKAFSFIVFWLNKTCLKQILRLRDRTDALTKIFN